MTTRGKAKDQDVETESGSTGAQDTAAPAAETEWAPDLCGAPHTLPLLSHVTCQRTAGHADEQPQAPDQVKHLARVAGALYVW